MRKPTVLIVEDEELVRMMAADVLAERDLPTVEAGTGEDALRMLDARSDIGLMIVDIKLPGGVDGLDLARTAAARFPDLPILVISGHQEPEDGNLPRRVRFMPKPFSAVGLNWAVDDALDVRRPSGTA